MARRIKKAQGLAVLALGVLAPAAWAGNLLESDSGATCVVERNDIWNASFLKCCTPSAQAGGSCRFEALADTRRSHGWDQTQFITFTGGSSF